MPGPHVDPPSLKAILEDLSEITSFLAPEMGVRSSLLRKGEENGF
jgi:hypothetical protein